jgi:hypothetical protein
MKKNGLTLFSKFSRLHLEVSVNKEDKDKFNCLYGVKTGESVNGEVNKRYRTGEYKSWGIAYRIYFDGPDWIVDSLNKLGYHVEKGRKMVDSNDFHQKNPDNGYTKRISNAELFWYLVDFGYRLGENSPIPIETDFDTETRKTMKPTKVNQKVAAVA